VPAETTCLLEPAALEAALKRVAGAFAAKHAASAAAAAAAAAGDRGDSGDGPGAAGAQQQQPLKFAVLYKSRGVDRQLVGAAATAAHQQGAGDAAAAGAAPQPQEASSQPLDRGGIIARAAAAMEAACSGCGGAKVNLDAPQVCADVGVGWRVGEG
jgi:hypothetical protein